jgi:DmsE family decaheme c-type cytochrome
MKGRYFRVFAALLIWLVAVWFSAASRAASDSPAPPPPPEQQKPAPAAPAPQKPTAPPAPAKGYAGAEVCATCHEGYDRSIAGSKHGFARDARTPAAAQGCESCHGPGEAHAQDPTSVKPRQFPSMAAREVNDTCTTCHNRTQHAMWAGSQHEARDVSCVSCHSVHRPKSDKAQLKQATVVQQCSSCHRDKVAKLDRSGHMPVREGKMTCTSCHNVHGSTNVRLLRVGMTVSESCTSCHQEKRGPFLFEHAGVSGESCATCHDPHGSSNDRMLVAKLPFLCQRCHNHTRHPSTIYDNKVTQSSNRLFSRSCVTCHSQIHGSNHPSGATFLR